MSMPSCKRWTPTPGPWSGSSTPSKSAGVLLQVRDRCAVHAKGRSVGGAVVGKIVGSSVGHNNRRGAEAAIMKGMSQDESRTTPQLALTPCTWGAGVDCEIGEPSRNGGYSTEGEQH